jgi:hypothetical protein
VGSDFFYEDVSGRGVDEDEHRLLKSDGKFYLIECRPQDPGSVEFSRYMVWIDKQSFMPVKAEYYDHEDTLYRRVEALEIKEIQGFPTVLRSRVENLAAGGNTVSEFSRIKYDIGRKADIFTERYLRRPPRQARR